MIYKSGFSDGLALFKEGTHYGYINKEGEVAIEAKFSFAGDFSEGYAPIQNTSGKWGFINRDGDIIINPKFKNMLQIHQWGFSEGLINVMIGDKVGYIDDCGETVIDPIYEWAKPFKGEYAIVKKNNRYGMINKKGKWVILPSFNSLDYPKEGLIRFEQDYRVGFMDIDSNIIIEKQYHSVSSSFNNGIAVVYDSDKSQHFGINKMGERVFNGTYRNLGYAGNGLYHFSLASHWNAKDRRIIGLMNSNEEVIVKDLASENFRFNENLAPVKSGRKSYVESYGVIDENGIWIVEPQYERIDAYREGLAFTKFTNKKNDAGFIDQSGKIVLRAI